MPPLDVKLGSLIDSLDAELGEADALTKVGEARQRARGLAELGDQLVDHYVSAARAGGASWAQIGDAMGVSKQAAQQRKGAAQFERYTPRARKVLANAETLARAANSPTIEPGHIVLAVLDEEGGLGAKVVTVLAGSVQAARDAVSATLSRDGQAPGGHIPFSPAGKQVVAQTMDAALQLGHNYVGTEHILLGALQLDGDPAVAALGELGITSQRARDAVEVALVGYQHRGGR
jgi:hypothetical protein